MYFVHEPAPTRNSHQGGIIMPKKNILFHKPAPSRVPCSQLGEHIAVAENAIRRRELGRLGVPGRRKKGIRPMITRRLGGWGWGSGGLFPGNRPRPPLCEMPQGLLHFRFREEPILCRKREIWLGKGGWIMSYYYDEKLIDRVNAFRKQYL